MIVAAAIKFGDVICFVPEPGRHHNVLHGLHDAYGKRAHGYDTETQGFITQTGMFLNRRDAFIYAKEIGQPLKRHHSDGYQGNELYSEDLW
jgi:hypothetical protein